MNPMVPFFKNSGMLANGSEVIVSFSSEDDGVACADSLTDFSEVGGVILLSAVEDIFC